VAASEPNAVARMLGQLGDEWTLLVLQQALMGATRYGEFQSRLPISHSVLSSRLRSLAEEGLLEPRVYQTNPPRREYLTTARSRSLWPVLVSIWDWERHWVPGHADDLPTMHHNTCGADFAPRLTCRSCGDDVTEKDVVAQWGPSGSWARSVPAVVTRRRSATGQAGLFPQTMTVLGNRWGFALLVAAFVGMSRFTDFQTQLGAPPGSIADRLSIFADNGVFVVADNRYRLTEKGRALFPVLISALQWAQRWFHAPEGPAVALTHTACGGRFTAVMTCDQCTRPLRGTQVSAR
jgi:DNA-binding HxlR family transcriptional regulator